MSLELLVRGNPYEKIYHRIRACGSGQPTQNQGARVGYLRILVRDLFNETQNTTVIRTSAATVMVSIQGVPSNCVK